MFKSFCEVSWLSAWLTCGLCSSITSLGRCFRMYCNFDNITISWAFRIPRILRQGKPESNTSQRGASFWNSADVQSLQFGTSPKFLNRKARGASASSHQNAFWNFQGRCGKPSSRCTCQSKCFQLSNCMDKHRPRSGGPKNPLWGPSDQRGRRWQAPEDHPAWRHAGGCS